MSMNDWSESVLIAELNDEPALSEDLDTVVRRIENRPESATDVILNFQAVSYLNSSNVGQLLRIRKKAVDGGVTLRLCGLHDDPQSVLHVTGLDQLFEITEDVTLALASVQIAE